MESYGVGHEKVPESTKEVVTLNESSPIDEVPATESGWGELQHDVADMARLGKKQEFKAKDPLPDKSGVTRG